MANGEITFLELNTALFGILMSGRFIPVSRVEYPLPLAAQKKVD